MPIVRIYVRTFQNEEHADLFLLFCQRLKNECLNNNLKINLTVIQNDTNKNQITSIWKYDDEKHLKTVRSSISKHVKMPNSLSPKEILYTGKVIIDS
tara:strand:- start:106 stop:396 length:291 start_codon:yes stop_codon:yes gene_type:complete